MTTSFAENAKKKEKKYNKRYSRQSQKLFKHAFPLDGAVEEEEARPLD